MEVFNAVGRRKRSVARVFLSKGKGEIIVNSKEMKEYFTLNHLRKNLEEPFNLLEVGDKYDLTISVRGGGIKGQAEAARLGIARALCKANPDFRETLKSNKMLTRDPRVVERKKPGLVKARKATQYSKR